MTHLMMWKQLQLVKANSRRERHEHTGLRQKSFYTIYYYYYYYYYYFIIFRFFEVQCLAIPFIIIIILLLLLFSGYWSVMSTIPYMPSMMKALELSMEPKSRDANHPIITSIEYIQSIINNKFRTWTICHLLRPYFLIFILSDTLIYTKLPDNLLFLFSHF